MRRRTHVALVAVVTALGVAITVPMLDEEEPLDPYLTFLTAHLDVLPTQPQLVSEDAKFSRTIAKFTNLATVDPALDACAGPVAVYLGDKKPRLVAEHDYCGGSDWMPKIAGGDVVQLTGTGIEPGLYTAEIITHVPRRGSTVGDLPDADVVLQTCINRSTMVLVGLRLLRPDQHV